MKISVRLLKNDHLLNLPVHRVQIASHVESYIANHWAIFRSATIQTDGRTDDPATLLSGAMLIQLKVPLPIVQDRRCVLDSDWRTCPSYHSHHIMLSHPVVCRLSPVYDGIRARIIDWRRTLDDRAAAGNVDNPESTPDSPRRRSSSPPPPSPPPVRRVAVLDYEPINRLFDVIEDKKLRLVDLFHTLDSDKSGFLDASELGVALERLDFPTTPTQLAGLLSVLDVDGNSRIDISEFLIRMRRLQLQRRAVAGSPPRQPARAPSRSTSNHRSLSRDAGQGGGPPESRTVGLGRAAAPARLASRERHQPHYARGVSRGRESGRGGSSTRRASSRTQSPAPASRTTGQATTSRGVTNKPVERAAARAQSSVSWLHGGHSPQARRPRHFRVSPDPAGGSSPSRATRG